MKKALAVLVALGLLSFGVMAFAHGGGGSGGYGGGGYGMMGGGYGGGGHGMMGGGYGMMGGGGGMMGGGGGFGGCSGPGGYGKAVDPEKRDAFFKDTLDLRKKLHAKMFELREAYFSGNEDKVEKLGKEAEGLQKKLYDAAKELGITSGEGYGRGYGGHMGQGYGGHMGPGMGW